MLILTSTSSSKEMAKVRKTVDRHDDEIQDLKTRVQMFEEPNKQLIIELKEIKNLLKK